MLEELLARVIIRAVAIWESASAGCAEAEIELLLFVYICEYNGLYGSLESG